MPALPDAVRHRHAAAAAAALLAERAAHSLVPVPAAGWRNVGQALHADTLTDAAGPLGVRARRPDQPVRRAGRWRTGTWSAPRASAADATGQATVDLTTVGRRAAPPLPGAPQRPRRLGERPRGTVDLRRCSTRGRRGRARRGGGRVPRPAARGRHQGARVAGRRRGGGRRAGRAGGDEDGAHAAGRRRRHGQPDRLRARASRSTWATCSWRWSRRERSSRRPLRIANCSGFFGDRLAAAREMVEGGPIDVLTGDWLAELTMYILHKTAPAQRWLRPHLPAPARRRPADLHRAGHHGGLQRRRARPRGAGRRGARAGQAPGRRGGGGLGVGRRHHGTPGRAAAGAGSASSTSTPARTLPAGAPVVTANAYLPARPIADALAAGAQVVVTGRVTDAALVVGPALHAFGWQDDDLDAIAGAVVAGHVIECGAQCCGGNYAFFEEIPRPRAHRVPHRRDARRRLVGHHQAPRHRAARSPSARSRRSCSTRSADPRYLSPDAVARFDTIALAQEGPDRVRIAGVRGEAPPPTLKVTANLDAGWRNAMTLAITGAQVEEKARMAADAVWAGIPGGRAAFAETAEDLSGDLSGGGMAYLRLAVRGDDELAVGRAFSGAVDRDQPLELPGHVLHLGPVGGAGRGPLLADHRRRSPRSQPHVECEGRQVPTSMPSVPDGRRRRRARRRIRDRRRRRLQRGRAGAGRRVTRARSTCWSAPARATRAARQRRACGRTTDDVAEWLLDELTVGRLHGAAARGGGASRSSATPWPICAP